MGARQQIRWYGDKWKRELRAEARRRNAACAIAVHNRAKTLLSVEGAGARVRNKATGGTEVVQARKGRRTIGALIYRAFPSRPGEPPHKQSGHLLGSVGWELVSNAVARVGTFLRYGRWLELGTRIMAARPWLRRALREMTPFIQAVWNRPWRL